MFDFAQIYLPLCPGLEEKVRSSLDGALFQRGVRTVTKGRLGGGHQNDKLTDPLLFSQKNGDFCGPEKKWIALNYFHQDLLVKSFQIIFKDIFSKLLSALSLPKNEPENIHSLIFLFACKNSISPNPTYRPFSRLSDYLPPKYLSRTKYLIRDKSFYAFMKQ